MDAQAGRHVQSTAMTLIQLGPVLAGGLFLGVLAFLELGRRVGRRRIASGGRKRDSAPSRARSSG